MITKTTLTQNLIIMKMNLWNKYDYNNNTDFTHKDCVNGIKALVNTIDDCRVKNNAIETIEKCIGYDKQFNTDDTVLEALINRLINLINNMIKN